ncbi:colicin V production protein [Candidatus Pantoea edessiphila]|uniref:Colicin V production protein n=1 Tax=Candidatus Pantoea edessiphila TaxID=2044610 RepID=A0A2P5T111_9GAMM|nr:CvpA family protein [Candidatus Pantoea edessiphila]PPI88232.1 colicin V production protein [Candidatus Pantoea edessiphila]
MNWIDYIIIMMICSSVIISLFRGFIYEALSLTTWMCAFLVSNESHEYFMIWFPYFQGNNLIRKIISIILPFFITMIIGTMLNHLIRIIVIRNGFSSTDRMLGICFGAIRGFLIIAFILFCVNICTDIPKTIDWRKSQLIPYCDYIIRIFFDYFKTYQVFRIDKNIKNEFF